MKFQKILNEIQGEIIKSGKKSGVPYGYMDDIAGNPIGKDKEEVMKKTKNLKNDPVGLDIIDKIVNALYKQDLIGKFNKKTMDKRDIGVYDFKTMLVPLYSDTGELYYYSIKKDKILKQEEV